MVVKLNKNCKKEFFDNFEIKSNSKSFRDKCRLYFSNKHSKGDSDILLIEKDELLQKNKKVADVFNSYFQSITDSLDLFEWPLGSVDQIYDSVERIIDSFRFHPSIKNIKLNYKITGKFFFKPVSKEFVKDIVNDLSSNKAAGGEIPLKILKECDFSFHFLTNCIHEAIKSNKFPDSLILSNIVPVHKKKDPTDKINYRPVSILPLLSKVKINSFKANPGKFQFMILGKKNLLKYRLKIGSIIVKESDDVELLGITIDKALNFKRHIENLCRTAQYKFHALRRIRKYLTLDKAKLLGNVFIDSQFNYAPLL